MIDPHQLDLHSVSVWSAEEPLSKLTLFSDWDPTAAMIASLRIHLFEYGTIPSWNYMFCGGRPELAMPFSWAYTWPSAFAYLFSPNVAIVVVWVLMTLVGTIAMRRLLVRWTGHRLASIVGACLYAFGGCFSARFSAGHVSFAFYHLVPVMMLLFEAGFEKRAAGGKSVRHVLWTAAIAFLFFTAALPHGLLYFYPAFALFVAVRVLEAAHRAGVRNAIRAFSALAVAHIIGAWLAAYKVWPAIRWQLDSPRRGVLAEAYSLLDIFRNTVSWVPSYALGPTQPWYRYPAFGYNAFVGEMAWLLALVAIVALGIRAHRFGRFVRTPLDPAAAGFSVVLVLVGVALALGNASSVGPAQFFRHIPILEGVRAFNRYQILIVFGLSVLAAAGFGLVVDSVRHGWPRRVAVAVLLLLTLGPVFAQAGLLIKNLPAIPHAKILEAYPALNSTEIPQLMGAVPKRQLGPYKTGHELALIEEGFWVAGCKSDLQVQEIKLSPGTQIGLTTPPPVRIVSLDHNTLALGYTPEPIELLVWNLTHSEDSEGESPVDIDVRLVAGDGAGLILVGTAHFPGVREGVWISAVGLAVGIAIFVFWIRTGQRST